MGNELASAAQHSGCFSAEEDKRGKSQVTQLYPANFMCDPNCLVTSEAADYNARPHRGKGFSKGHHPAAWSPSRALEEADRVVESNWMHSPVLKNADSFPRPEPVPGYDVPMASPQKGCDAPLSQAVGPKLTEDALKSLDTPFDAPGMTKGMGKGKGKPSNRCDSMASNFAMAGSFAKGAGRMSFQAGVMQGSRGSFAQPRSDASFAVGLPQSAANAGRSRQSFTTQPSEGFSSMPLGGTSTQPPPQGSSTKQQMGRMGRIHE